MAAKTIYEWLQELPEPTRTEAVQQTKLANAEELSESLPEALARAFDWDRSPQGFTYWSDKFDNLINEITLELHQILDNLRVQVVKLMQEKEEGIKSAVNAYYQKDSEPDHIVYAIRVLNDMQDRCDSPEETIEMLKVKHKELCEARSKTK